MQDIPAEDKVEALALDYIARREDGETPNVMDYESQLVDDGEREDFRALVSGATWARSLFPVQLQAQHVIAGRYRLIEELGAGGMGKVWAAHDQDLDRRVAVKVMSLVAKDETETEETLGRESKAMARMRHPGSVAIHEAGRDGDLFYLVMDLVDGRSIEACLNDLCENRNDGDVPAADELRSVIRRECPTGQIDLLDRDNYFRSAVRIIIEVLRTLEAAHMEGVIHRDIKPTNIMLTGGGHPVLLDFGLAALRGAKTANVTERLIGTVNYLAPEQVLNNKVGADVRTDIYQVGLVLYDLLTLKPAFSPDDVQRILGRVEAGTFTRPRKHVKHLPKELEDIVLKSMEVTPKRRYQDAKSFRVDLERWLEGRELPEASRNGQLGSLIRNGRYTLRRNRLPIGILMAAVLLVSLAIPAWGFFQDRAAVEVNRTQVTATGVDLNLTTPRMRTVFAYALVDDLGEKALVPLRFAEGWSTTLYTGDSELSLQLPEGQDGWGEDLQPEIYVASAEDRSKLARLEKAWDRFGDFLAGEGEGLAGVPEDEFRAVFQQLASAARGGAAEAEGTVPLSADDLLAVRSSEGGLEIDGITLQMLR